jgi:hypothetical protein
MRWFSCFLLKMRVALLPPKNPPAGLDKTRQGFEADSPILGKQHNAAKKCKCIEVKGGLIV